MILYAAFLRAINTYAMNTYAMRPSCPPVSLLTLLHLHFLKLEEKRVRRYGSATVSVWYRTVQLP